MPADFHYLKCPRQTWFFVYAIPRDLRGKLLSSTGRAKDKIVESLNTKDPDLARERRNERLVHWDRQFRRLRHGPSEDDIIEQATEIYRATLKDQAGQPTTEHNYLPMLKYGVMVVKEARERELFERSDSSFVDKMHGQDSYLAHLDDAIKVNVRHEIADYCQRTGAVLEPGTEPYRKVGIAFIKAKIAAGDQTTWLPLPDGRQIWGAEQHLPPLPKIEPPAPPAKRTADTFGDAFETYLETELSEDTSADTITEYKRKAKLFTDRVGDLPLRNISRSMAADFLDVYLLQDRKLSKRTRNLYASLFSAVYKSAIRRGRIVANPFEGQRIKKVATNNYKPFTSDELTKLFDSATFEVTPTNHTTKTALPWCALIAAFTGCRREEIATLMASDIKRTGGIWFFDICAGDYDGKSDAAPRVVPLHHALIDASLLRYRDTLPPGSRLFPGLRGRKSKGGKLGPALGDAFETWRKNLGINRESVNFHSFRHSVGDVLRKAGVSEDDRGALLGHADTTTQSKVYGHDGPGLRRLQKVVEAIEYPGLVLPGSA
jgi:integrase